MGSVAITSSHLYANLSGVSLRNGMASIVSSYITENLNAGVTILGGQINIRESEIERNGSYGFAFDRVPETTSGSYRTRATSGHILNNKIKHNNSGAWYRLKEHPNVIVRFNEE